MIRLTVALTFIFSGICYSEEASRFPHIVKELSVYKAQVECGEPLLVQVCVTKKKKLDLLSYRLGGYSESRYATFTFEIRKEAVDSNTRVTEYSKPTSNQVGGLGDNQTLRLERTPCDVTYSRVDVLYLSEPGQYRIRGVVDWQYAFGESLDALETVHVNDWTNWVTVTVRPPKHEAEKAQQPSKAMRDALMERMFEYYYPQEFVYYSYEWERRWDESRGRKRFSLEALWRGSLDWSRENPWREYVHFTAAAEAIADSMTRFRDERDLRDRESLPEPYRPEYVAEVVCKFFEGYPDSWLIPQLLYHYNRFFFSRFGRAVPCIEEAYNKYAQQTDPVHAALHRADGRPNRRVIFNIYTYETEVVVE